VEKIKKKKKIIIPSGLIGGHRGLDVARLWTWGRRWLAVPTKSYQRCARTQSVRSPRSVLVRSGSRTIVIFHIRFIS
jgi:hypothetical protein